MFHQNSNRTDMSCQWDREHKRLYVISETYPCNDIINQKFELDELADLRDMIVEILDLEGYKE